jgi:predicted TIM-barrel fold metal-dependent hydrolase
MTTATSITQERQMDLGAPADRTVTLLPDPEPREVKNLIISVDDHIIEPPDMFEGRIPSRLAERAPKMIVHNGVPGWLLEDRHLPNFGLNAVAGRPPEEWDDEPRQWDEMRKGCYEVEARIHDMDINGVYASVNFPSRVAGFGGVRFSEVKDQELGLACVHAWNDWHHDEWAGKHPDRLIPLQVPWLNDPEVAADEIRRNAERGFKAVTWLDNPLTLGRPALMTDYWDPFLRACEETDTVISCHIGASGGGIGAPNPALVDAMQLPGAGKVFGAIATASTLTAGISASVVWLYSGVFTRFPRLKVTLAESGAGWVPALLDRLDYMDGHAGHAFTGAWKDPDLKPGEVLLRNVWFCAFDDRAAITMRDRIGVENILLEVDYPHGDGTWPDTQDFVMNLLKGVPADEVRKLTHENAAQVFRHPLPAERPVTVS